MLYLFEKSEVQNPQSRINELFLFLHFIFLIILVLMLISFSIYPQKSNITFEHFSIDNGMSESIVTCILQDRAGFLWFGTWAGIERYDGYNFTAYKHDPRNPASIDNAFVQTLYEDKSGILWIGTWNGLERFDPATEKFTHFRPHPQDSADGSSNHVFSICEDKSGVLWVAIPGDGLHKFDRVTGKFICIRYDPNDPGSLSHNNVNAIYKDREGSLWIGTGGGLDKLDGKTGKFIHYWSEPTNHTRKVDKWGSQKYWVNCIYEGSDGMLWLGTNGGLIEFNPKDSVYTNYSHDPKNLQSISSNNIASICQDNSGTIWISTYQNGLNSFDKNSKIFTRYLHDKSDLGSLSGDYTLTVYCERSGTVWIGTNFVGLNKINRTKPTFNSYLVGSVNKIVKSSDDKLWISASNRWMKFDPNKEQFTTYSFENGDLLSEDSTGSLWIALRQGGLIKLDKYGHISRFYDSKHHEFKQAVVQIYETSDGILWIGTETNGLYCLDPFTQIVRQTFFIENQIFSLYEDTFSSLWVGTLGGGLLRFNKARDSVTLYKTDRMDTASISANSIMDIHEDKNGILWFGTGIGLNKFDRATNKFTHYTEQDGLASNVVFSVLEDGSGNLWHSTRKGISKFDPKTKRFKNYDISYGLPRNGFKRENYQTKNGELYYGSNGTELFRFHPDSIKDNPYIPPIIITSIRKFEQLLTLEKEVHLPYSENFLSFEFVALSYVSPERNQYAYKMEGVDKNWVYSGTRRFASYPNLEPGEYVFKVKGSNNDGVWNEEGTSIAIIISPPWWKTWWAYLSYACIFIFALYGIRRYEMNRISYKNQVKVDKAVLTEKEETDKMKSRFFANISHEFRTPLTLILGPAEKIISKTSDDVIKDANIIKRNSRRLLQLINQLLDLSKLESGKIKLEASKGNIVSFVKGVALSFESLAESKDITLSLLPEKDFIELYFDKEKMMKILTNLLSNAFKFTPDEGMVTVCIKEIKNSNKVGTVEIKIKDTGIGIPQEEIPKLFDRFYQVDSSFTKEHEGTGIGLALTKELVELHHGKIFVESKVDDPDNPPKADKTTWSEFTVTLPLGTSHLKGDEIVKTEINEVSIRPGEQEVYTSLIRKTATDSIAISIHDGVIKDQLEERTIILVVEDNYDMREYIKESLGNGYRVEEAVNGEQGVRKAEKIIPDLIISDMMMPKMDGSELTRILKNNEKTSHIPIILLTARSGQENKIEGLETGADDYLTKPFDIRELQARIENLINIRKKLQAKYSKLEYVLMPDGKKGTSLDEQFITKVMEVIDKHISEEEFSIEEFGSEVGMSRTQFHRKIKAVTGKPASMFLRSVRLARAKKMIEEQHGNISEIAFLVGFSTPSYFTKCFKEEFGYVPSDLNS